MQFQELSDMQRDIIKPHLPKPARTGRPNEHDSAKFVDVLESLNEYLDDDSIGLIVAVYVNRGYNTGAIREYLAKRNINDCIPPEISKQGIVMSQNKYNKTRDVVEKFFAWFKCGFNRIRIRCKRIAENCLAFLSIASIMMCWRVLG